MEMNGDYQSDATNVGKGRALGGLANHVSEN